MSTAQVNPSFLSKNAQYYEYSTSVDPLGVGLISQVPFREFSHTLHETSATQLIALDSSDLLNCPYPATSPALLANFVHILPKESITIEVNATSQFYYVIRGNGHSLVGDLKIPWNTGDFFVLPAHAKVIHYAETDSAFYFIHDEPLLTYLGVKFDLPQFEPTLYLAETTTYELQKAIEKARTEERNRLAILLANKKFPQTRTITHTLWAMFGILPENQIQPPHRHQSVAVDFVVDCQPGCYTLIGTDIDQHGHIINPTRVDWKPYSVFVTPPGFWHAHYNESGVQAHIIPLQDAGLHNYLRTLDIRFVVPDKK
jgi:gentisate 1,2-dioxygenase